MFSLRSNCLSGWLILVLMIGGPPVFAVSASHRPQSPIHRPHIAEASIASTFAVPPPILDPVHFHWDSSSQGGFIMSLCSDIEGRLWVGTEDKGVWRYDAGAVEGRQWVQFTTREGLGDDNAYALCCDREDRIWCGTLNHGVSVCSRGFWKNYDQTSGPLGAHVTALAVNPRNGDVWGATEAGLFRYSDSAQRWRYYSRSDGLPSNQASGLAFASDGTLYVATFCDGLAIADANAEEPKWKLVKGPSAMPTAPAGNGLPSNQLNCVLVTPKNILYVGTDCGLAVSHDRGKTFHFTRGADWKARVEGLAKSEKPASTVSETLAEDYVTCLATAPSNAVLVGHRERWTEYLHFEKQLPIRPQAPNGVDYAQAMLLARNGMNIVGSYGTGLVLLSNLADKKADTALPTGSLENFGRKVIFPSPASAPSIAEIAAWKARVKSLPHTPAAPASYFLGEDWSTQGDWVGHYGQQYAVMCAAASYLDQSFSWHRDYIISAQMGSHHTKGDGLRNWLHWAHTDNPRSLYSPAYGFRRQSEWDDHGEAYSRTFEGPDVWITVTVPAGVHRVSLYDMNKDGHDSDNRYRDYLIDLLPYRATTDEARALQPLAHARIRNFWGGVYEQFVVRGPAKYYLRIKKGGSKNTICAAVFIDKLLGPKDPLDDQSIPCIPEYYKPPNPDAVKYSQRPPAPLTPGEIATTAAARDLWTTLDRAYENPASMDLQTPYRLQSYRAIASPTNDYTSLESSWRWRLNLWSRFEHETFEHSMSTCYYLTFQLSGRPQFVRRNSEVLISQELRLI